MSLAVSTAQAADIAVFALGARTNGLPSHRVTRDDAEWMVTNGLAAWVNNRRKSLRMLINAIAFKIRGASCQMKPWVVEEALMGSRSAQELVAAWRGRRAVAYRLPQAA